MSISLPLKTEWDSALNNAPQLLLLIWSLKHAQLRLSQLKAFILKKSKSLGIRLTLLRTVETLSFSICLNGIKELIPGSH